MFEEREKSSGVPLIKVIFFTAHAQKMREMNEEEQMVFAALRLTINKARLTD